MKSVFDPYLKQRRADFEGQQAQDLYEKLTTGSRIVSLTQSDVDFFGAALLAKNNVHNLQLKRNGTALEIYQDIATAAVTVPDVNAIAIKYPEDLFELADTPANWGKSFYLANDIDFDGLNKWKTAIGRSNAPFTGK
ncbi:MAG: hypothetical protein OIF34_13170, partial [Porticoccaceae bacterium]|nr:hypothetical protein [Porticoccaceae bacterium]